MRVWKTLFSMNLRTCSTRSKADFLDTLLSSM
jgi:hypothetical protein